MPSRHALWCVLAGVALPAQELTPGELQALFESTLSAGPDSPAGRDLRRHGPAAVGFLAGLLDQEARAEVHLRALDHLMRMGTAAAPAVDAMLRQVAGTGDTCHWAIVALGEIGPFLPAERREGIGKVLIDRYHKEPTVPLAHYVVRAWHRQQFPATDDVNELMGMLRSGNPFAIEIACQLLAEQGAKAAAAMALVEPLLRQAVFLVPPAMPNDADRRIAVGTNWYPQVRDSLFALCSAVDPNNPIGLPLVLERLARGVPAVQVQLLQQVGRMGPEAASAVPSVLTMLQSKAPEVVREAVTVLGIIGSGSEAAKAAVAALVASPDKQTAARAKAALRGLGG